MVTGSSKKHRSTSKHDCAAEGCRLHVCRPMAASTVRQIHSIISGTLSAATRWDWISSNPARVAQRPKSKAPEPNPPSASEAARLLAAAFEMDEDWGTLVWLVMTTGIRRGEVCALRWRDIALDAEIVEIRRNYVLHRGVGAEKDTKTHQMRRIALDSETIGLLREQQNRVAPRLDQLGARIDGRRSCSVARSRRITRCPTRPMRSQVDIGTWLPGSVFGRTSTRFATIRRPSCSPLGSIFAPLQVGLGMVVVGRRR